MYLQLVRESFTDKSTEGKIFLSGTQECFALEDKDRFLEDGGKKVYGKTAIPRGTYQVKLTYSNRFQRVLPLLLNVPQFKGIRIHPGNYPEDTDGCILVGDINTKEDDDFIGQSRVAFDRLFKKMQEAEEREEQIDIEIV